jgi:hypothetical protein
MQEDKPVIGSMTAGAARKKAEFFEDHRALQVVLGRVEGTRDLNLLVPLLEELHRLLQGHFSREEAPDGPYNTIEEAAPHHLGRLQELVGEHRAFLANVRELEGKVRACLDGPVAEIHDAVRHLCDRLQQHEADETSLFMDALYTDLGESN